MHRLLFLVTLPGSGFQLQTFLYFQTGILMPISYSDCVLQLLASGIGSLPAANPQLPYQFPTSFQWELNYRSESKLCYNWRSVGQSVMVSSTVLHPTPDIHYSHSLVLSCTVAAGPHQHSHSQVWILWFSWPYFTLSESRLLRNRVSQLDPQTVISRLLTCYNSGTVEVLEPAAFT
jgi:hypothetical protein